MKCQYCGSNLGIEDEVCPYCGKVNDQAAGHQAVMKEYRDEYEKTKTEVKKESISAGRKGKLIVIGLMLAAIILMRISISINSDVSNRESKKENKIAREVSRNRKKVTARLQEMEKNRDYLALSYYMQNYRLRSDNEYSDYTRVFTAVISYRTIYEDILNIIDGFDGYQDKTARDHCHDIAIYISDWNNYVRGQFWSDNPDSAMHKGEHGAFLADIRQETQDMVQVYFDLTDEQATSMWDMDRDSLGDLLYENCSRLYPEGAANE
ncbi:MAG: zinc ribbon domain-containing protein [Lachnospiraceae bacterium]|nr:zinc ribbon domain-containing protein [Lachnospiraceae bacterium]